MLQTQYTQSTNQKQKKNHSRKQLLEWIANQANNQQKTIALSFNQSLLKNGVFFLVILQKLFPQEASFIKSKIKQKPVSQYDFDKNFTLVKKILDKYNFQYSLDINDIIKNKGCFDFLNWIKNLNDGLIQKPIDEANSSKHMSSEKMTSPMKKSQMAHSGYKINRQGSAAKSGQKTHSQAKSTRNYSSQKSQNAPYKTKTGKNLVQITNKQLPVLQNNRSHVVQQQQSKYSKLKKSIYMSEWDSLDDCNEAMYQLALQENIHAFKSILKKVKQKITENEGNQSLEQFLQKIHKTMFGRN